MTRISNSLVPDNQNHWIEVRTEALFGCLNAERLKDSFIDREELLNLLPMLLNASDQFIMLGLFEGLTLTEIAEATSHDCYGGIMHCKKRNLPISEELETIIAEASTETIYFTPAKTRKEIPLADGDELVRKIDNGKPSGNIKAVIGARFRRAVKTLQLSENLTLMNMRESGRMEMIRGILKENGITLHDFLYDTKLRIPVFERYGKIQNLMSYERLYRHIIIK